MILAFEDALIRLHFRHVGAALRRRSAPNLGPATRVRRLRAIEELDRYRRTKPLPRNTYTPGRTPVFVDELGARCAVAHLIEASGRPELVQRTRLRSNLARIHEMEDRDLASWAMEHGLTTGELARIQPTYSLGPEPGSVETLLAITSAGLVAVMLSAVALARRWIRGGVAAFVVALGLAVAVAVVAHQNPSCEGICSGYARPRFIDPLLYGFWLLTMIVGVRWLYRRRLLRTHRSSAPSRPARQYGGGEPTRELDAWNIARECATAAMLPDRSVRYARVPWATPASKHEADGWPKSTQMCTSPWALSQPLTMVDFNHVLTVSSCTKA